MKPVVLYASRHGHTQRYAQWLGESLGCPVWNVKGLSPASLASYDTIVLGGSLYAGRMGGLSFLTRHAKAQKWVLFTCGAADPALEVIRQNIRNNMEKALPENRRDTPLFFLRGGLDYSRLSPLHIAPGHSEKEGPDRRGPANPEHLRQNPGFYPPGNFAAHCGLSPKSIKKLCGSLQTVEKSILQKELLSHLL